MDFIETLKIVGGVKPCPCGISTQELTQEYAWKYPNGCAVCRGTGQILDLDPLLAKPTVLHGAVDTLLLDWWDKHPYRYMQDFTNFKKMYKNLYIVGPQRAHSLVYECARQLGGTAVVAEHKYVSDVAAVVAEEPNCDWPPAALYDGYRLSLPIPPDATVLFVTDRMDEQEMLSCVRALYDGDGAPEFGWARKILPYVLALISNIDSFQGMQGTNHTVIALHKEKP